MSFCKKNYLSVCLPDFFESADARDLGLMTLFSHNLITAIAISRNFWIIGGFF